MLLYIVGHIIVSEHILELEHSCILLNMLLNLVEDVIGYSVCNTLQHAATHCNTLQHTATHCSILQHTATHCIVSCRRYYCSVLQRVEV